MDPSVIKQFLVGLGFGVDDAGLKKFNDAIKSATLKVTALYASIKASSAAIFFGISKISQGLEQIGYEYRIIAPALNKELVLRNELLKAYRKAGVNITQAIVQSVKFNMALAKTQFAFKALFTSVSAKFFPMLTKQMDVFRGKIYANMPKIQATLEKFVNFVFKAFEATVILGNRIWSILQRVYDFFYKLHQATDGWSTLILGAIAAWKLLNLSFLATPFGMLIAGIVALLALWDDFMTFKEGGESFINWGSETTKMIVGLVTVIGGLAAVIGGVVLALKAWAIAQAAVNALMMLNPIGLIIAAVTALIGLLAALDAKWNLFGGHISGFFSGIGGKVMDFLGGDSGNVSQNMQNNPGAGQNRPMGVGVAGSQQTNQNVNQQTQINVVGAADAGAVGKHVANEQGRVNYDMVRNLTGATR